MRFDTSTNTPPPLTPSWRIILWTMTLAPALFILGWSLRQARLPKPEFGSVGITAEEIQRLKRILKEPQAEASPLRGDAVRVVGSADDVGETPARQAGSDVRLDKSTLVSIKDNTFGVTAAEKPAYDAILAKVRNTALTELEPLAQQDVPFAVLMLNADRYRGEVLTIEGDIRRLNQLTDQTFEAWLFTADSGINPYRIVLASVPDGVRLGDDLQPPIRARLSGYFFKRFSYATAQDFHTAPLLLAKTLTVLSQTRTAAPRPAGYSDSLTYLAIGLLVALLIVGVAMEVIFRGRSRRQEARPLEPAESPPDFSWLDRS